ncbi:MAG: hypothetical protein AB2794_07540, partial [Candidatus Thiodiazotropha endolucinida]
MLPRQQALRCLRGRKAFASVLTGPSVFSGRGIACFPDSRPCGLSGAAHFMLPLQQALRSLRRSNHFASLQTGPTVFSGT